MGHSYETNIMLTKFQSRKTTSLISVFSLNRHGPPFQWKSGPVLRKGKVYVLPPLGEAQVIFPVALAHWKCLAMVKGGRAAANGVYTQAGTTGPQRHRARCLTVTTSHRHRHAVHSYSQSIVRSQSSHSLSGSKRCK